MSDRRLKSTAAPAIWLAGAASARVHQVLNPVRSYLDLGRPDALMRPSCVRQGVVAVDVTARGIATLHKSPGGHLGAVAQFAQSAVLKPQRPGVRFPPVPRVTVTARGDAGQSNRIRIGPGQPSTRGDGLPKGNGGRAVVHLAERRSPAGEPGSSPGSARGRFLLRPLTTEGESPIP